VPNIKDFTVGNFTNNLSFLKDWQSCCWIGRIKSPFLRWCSAWLWSVSLFFSWQLITLFTFYTLILIKFTFVYSVIDTSGFGRQYGKLPFNKSGTNFPHEVATSIDLIMLGLTFLGHGNWCYCLFVHLSALKKWIYMVFGKSVKNMLLFIELFQ
jgi:hypothetical protein